MSLDRRDLQQFIVKLHTNQILVLALLVCVCNLCKPINHILLAELLTHFKHQSALTNNIPGQFYTEETLGPQESASNLFL